MHRGAARLGDLDDVTVLAVDAAVAGVVMDPRPDTVRGTTWAAAVDRLTAARDLGGGVEVPPGTRELTVTARLTAPAQLRRVAFPASLHVRHNTCKVEEHRIGNQSRRLFVHRKGATRAFGPGHPDIPPDLQTIGQPVLIGGTMGTASYLLVGTTESMHMAYGSACHGAGRSMSRHQATRLWHGGKVIDDLAKEGILIRSPSKRGVAEEAPGAYKDVTAVVDAAEEARLARKVAKMRPLICIKG